MNALLEYASYMPHGYCLFWQPWLVILYAGSDVLIFLSYAMIPVALARFLRRRPDVQYRGLVALFAAFILLCGLTHLVSVVTLWVPVYPLHGVVKLLTGLVSAATALMLFRLLPRLVAIPSPSQLEQANARLRAEVDAHMATLAELRDIQRSLEERVDARTAELTRANEQLSLVTREAIHRARNLLAVVNSLAAQTARTAPDHESFLSTFTGRIQALSTATSAVRAAPGQVAASLGEVLRTQLRPMLDSYGGRLRVAGPPVEVGAEGAQQLCLAVHELATNAVKHGALSGASGRVDLTWEVRGQGQGAELALAWQETGGERGAVPGTGEPSGFGTKLLSRAVPGALGGSASREFSADGFRYRLTVPLERVAANARMREEDLDDDQLAGAYAAHV